MSGIVLPAAVQPFATWLGSVGPLLAGVGACLGVILLLGFMSVSFVAKGGGQYGIIEGYVGTIGAGKTSLAVQHALMLARARDAVLLANIGLRCGPTCVGGAAGAFGERGAGCLLEHRLLPLTAEGLDMAALMECAFQARASGRGLVLLMDEVGIIMPARLWAKFPVGLMWMIQQSRRVACEWVWTAQDPSFVDKQLRDLTAVVHYVRSYPPPSIWRRSKGKRPWMLVASAYLPNAAPRANGDGTARASLARIGRRFLRYRRRWEGAFDTDEIVLPPSGFAGSKELAAAVHRGVALAGIGSGFAVSDLGPLSEGKAVGDE